MKKKGFIAEFKEFISRGNVLDLAVGVIIGGAFSAITASMTSDIIMPILAIFLGGIDFSEMKIVLPNIFGIVSETPNTLNYGNFLNAVINFLIMALVVFIIVKTFNKAHELANKKKAEEEAKAKAEADAAKAKEEAEKAAAEAAKAAEPTREEKLLMEIRDLLKAQKNG